MCDAAIINFKMCVEKIEGIVKEKPMATKKKILYIVEAMGGGVFTYIVDVFLLPSRWEGLPISLLESMYMKKICVVSNVIGNRDVIHLL